MTDTEQKLTDFKLSKSGPIHALEVLLRFDSDDDYPVGRRIACSIVLLWLPLLVIWLARLRSGCLLGRYPSLAFPAHSPAPVFAYGLAAQAR